MEEEKPKVKLIYKKSLMVELVRKNHNLLYSMRNKDNPKYQVFAFEATKELSRDLAKLTGHEHDEDMRK